MGAVRFPRPAPPLRGWPGWMTGMELRRFVARRVTVHASPPRIDWAYQGVTATLAAVASDPRVRLYAADVRLVLEGRAMGRSGRGMQSCSTWTTGLTS